MGDMFDIEILPDDLNAAKRFIHDQKDSRAAGMSMETMNSFLLTSAADFKDALKSAQGDIGPLAAWVLAVGLKAGYDKGYDTGYEVGKAEGYDIGYDEAKLEE